MPAVDEALQETDSRALRPAQRYLLTVPQFADAHPAFPISSLRWLLYQRKGNGLHKSGGIPRRISQYLGSLPRRRGPPCQRW